MGNRGKTEDGEVIKRHRVNGAGNQAGGEKRAATRKFKQSEQKKVEKEKKKDC